MTFNMVCIKFDQKIKNLNFSGFLGFFKKPKNLGFFRSHFPALDFILLAKFAEKITAHKNKLVYCVHHDNF